MLQFKLKNHPKQQFSVLLGTKRVSFLLWYSKQNDRWSFDLSLDDQPILHGRRVVTGIDLLVPFRLGIGIIIAFSESDAAPNRGNLPDGTVGFYHLTQEEVDETVAT